MFSVIIPTMWYANIYLEKLLNSLEESDSVGEIIIIDNNWLCDNKVPITHSKAIVLAMPNNIYVNQAWNIGVFVAKYDNICISNDDLYWDVKCLPFVTQHLNNNVIGLASANYDQKENFDNFYLNKIINREWGWGCCMFINKKNWVDIPNDLKIACGDDWIIKHNNAMSIYGVAIEFENVSRTSIRSEFFNIQKLDIKTFDEKYKVEIKPSKDNVFFYWDGHISEKRFEILKNCIYSTKIFNPNRNVYLISNSISSSQFNGKIDVVKWDDSFFNELPFDKLKMVEYKKASPRDFSDLFRLILLYKFGGSYVDTDDLCIREMSDKKNLVCRSYDPHTSFYNSIKDDDCVPGYTREIRGYDHINMFPRNDCWQNWEPKSEFIFDMLSNEKFISKDGVVWIGGDFSWQSITNETCNKRLDSIGDTWNYGLTLLYLFEDFVATSSIWDRCVHSGEMCDIWNELPNMNSYNWGDYKCNQSIAFRFYLDVISKYPYLSHMWLHLKEAKEEWFIDIDIYSEYSMSTWIYHFIKEEIKLKMK